MVFTLYTILYANNLSRIALNNYIPNAFGRKKLNKETWKIFQYITRYNNHGWQLAKSVSSTACIQKGRWECKNTESEKEIKIIISITIDIIPLNKCKYRILYTSSMLYQLFPLFAICISQRYNEREGER